MEEFKELNLSSKTSSAIAQTSTLSKRTEILLKVAMVIISPLLLIGLLEGAAYVWEQWQASGPYAWELVASRRIDLVSYYEPGAGYTLMQPGSQYEWQGILVDINAHGLRGPETTYEKPPDTFRILNLGDSVAMGWGIREEDTYGRQLERLLNEQATGNRHYEVINAGVPGWNPENELAYLQAEGLKFKPDLILLDMTLANDIYGKSALDRSNPPPALIKWLRVNTYFWPFLTVQLRWLEARSKGRERIDVIDPPTEPANYFPLDPKANQWSEVWNRVSAMYRLAKENHIPFVLVFFPLEFQVLDKSYSTLPQELLVGKATEAGIPVLNLLPAYQQACQQKPGSPCYVEDRYLFADMWMHPSAYGHQLTTVELKAFLDRLLVLQDFP